MENKLPVIVTSPVAYGVQVEWRWPVGAHWYSHIELQYLRPGKLPVSEIFPWPVTDYTISGIKAGENIQVRLRPLDKEGNGPAWTASDWQDGAASYDVQDYMDEIDKQVRNTGAFKALNGDASIKESEIQPASIAASAIKEEAAARAEAIAKDDLARKEGMPTKRIGSFDVKDDSIVFKDGDGAVRVRVGKIAETSTVETIEQRTLSAVLSNSLHLFDAAQAGDTAVKIAQAVKSAFQTLNSGFAAGGYVSSQWGIKMDPSVSHTTECVDKSERSDCESDAHDPVSLKAIKDSREDDMLTFGGYPGAQLRNKLAVNGAASQAKVILSRDMKEAISDVVLNVIKEQSKPGGLLYRQ
jgi:hypothetical protein